MTEEITEKIYKILDILGDVFMNVFCISMLIFVSMQLKAPELAVIATAIISVYSKWLEHKTPKQKIENTNDCQGLKKCLVILLGYFILFKK